MTLEFFEEGHRYAWNGRTIPSVTQCLKSLYDFDSIPPDVLERKRIIGTRVHRAIELEMHGRLDISSLDPASLGYFNAWRRFRDDVQFEVILNEHKVTNAELGEKLQYAGTLDFYGVVQNARAIIDWKTTLITNTPAVGSQLAAYLRALIKMDLVDASLSDRRFALKLGSDGRYKLERFRALDEDWQRFVLQLRATVMLGGAT